MEVDLAQSFSLLGSEDVEKVRFDGYGFDELDGILRAGTTTDAFPSPGGDIRLGESREWTRLSSLESGLRGTLTSEQKWVEHMPRMTLYDQRSTTRMR
jgi:hypothetical protein